MSRHDTVLVLMPYIALVIGFAKEQSQTQLEHIVGPRRLYYEYLSI